MSPWTNHKAADIERLQARANILVQRNEQLLAQADAEKRELTTDEQRAISRRAQQADAMLDEMRELQDEIDNPRACSGSLSDPPPASALAKARQSSAYSGTRTISTGGGHRMAPLPTTASGADAVLGAMNLGSGGRDSGPFASFGDFARAVRTNHPSLYNYSWTTGATEGDASGGGFLVPGQWAYDLMSMALEAEVVRPRALVIPMASNQLVLPAFDGSDRSGGDYAGVRAYTVPEKQEITASKPKVREINLVAKKIAILIPVTNELLEDSGVALTTLLSAHMAEALAHSIDARLLTGTGAGEPMGILNAACGITVAKEGSQPASTVTVNNLAGMLTRLDPASFKRAVWICHPSVVAQLLTLQMKVKNVAGNENVGGWGPSWFQLDPDGQMALLGRPLVTSDQLPELGTEGDILLADLNRYVVGIVGGGPRLAVDSSEGFSRNITMFRLTIRLDGAPALHAPITPRNGPTVSPIIKLATRS